MERKRLIFQLVVPTMLVRFVLFIVLSSPFFPEVGASKETKMGDRVNTGAGITEQHELEPFDTINLSGVGNLYVKQTATQGFSIDADESILPLIKVSVINKVLNIELKDASSHNSAKINYNLNVKEIKEVNLLGNSAVYIEDDFNSHVFSLSINDLGEAHIKKINVDKLNVKIYGGATVEVGGVADQQSIVINGAGEFNGSKLSGGAATVNITDTGTVKVNASNSLTVAVAGEGKIQYCGKPNITKKDFSSDAIILPLPNKECK